MERFHIDIDLEREINIDIENDIQRDWPIYLSIYPIGSISLEDPNTLHHNILGFVTLSEYPICDTRNHMGSGFGFKVPRDAGSSLPMAEENSAVCLVNVCEACEHKLRFASGLFSVCKPGLYNHPWVWNGASPESLGGSVDPGNEVSTRRQGLGCHVCWAQHQGPSPWAADLCNITVPGTSSQHPPFLCGIPAKSHNMWQKDSLWKLRLCLRST